MVWCKCPVCNEEFKNFDNRNSHRANLTCGPKCHALQRAERQRERRYKRRQARLLKAAQKLAKRGKLKPASIKRWVAHQTAELMSHANPPRARRAA